MPSLVGSEMCIRDSVYLTIVVAIVGAAPVGYAAVTATGGVCATGAAAEPAGATSATLGAAGEERHEDAVDNLISNDGGEGAGGQG